jgi:hypothetical protein
MARPAPEGNFYRTVLKQEAERFWTGKEANFFWQIEIADFSEVCWNFSTFLWK